jgi:hypothetical protein
MGSSFFRRPLSVLDFADTSRVVYLAIRLLPLARQRRREPYRDYPQESEAAGDVPARRWRSVVSRTSDFDASFPSLFSFADRASSHPSTFAGRTIFSSGHGRVPRRRRRSGRKVFLRSDSNEKARLVVSEFSMPVSDLRETWNKWISSVWCQHIAEVCLPSTVAMAAKSNESQTHLPPSSVP